MKPGQSVINKLEQIELLKCCPYKFGMCCECTSKKKLKCMKKCLQEKVAIDAVDGSFVKSHVLFCGFACQACDRVDFGVVMKVSMHEAERRRNQFAFGIAMKVSTNESKKETKPFRLWNRHEGCVTPDQGSDGTFSIPRI